MIVNILRLFALLATAFVIGKLVTKLKLPAILGWLIAGMLLGPYLAGVVGVELIESQWYQIFVKIFECFAGVMIGSEIIFKKIAKSGKQIGVITVTQSAGTFLFVTLVFGIVFWIMSVPIYLAFMFGGIALATAPAPALSIVNEFKTKGPVTDTLLPVAAIDDVIAIIVFFTIITIVSTILGTSSISPFMVVLMTILPFIIGIIVGFLTTLIIKKIKNPKFALLTMIGFLLVCVVSGLLFDKFVFGTFSINFLLVGMAFSATVANLIKEEQLNDILKLYDPILAISFIVVIVNLGLGLDYNLILGAGLFTAIYIIARAIGKIGGSFVGGKLSKANPNITKYLGLTLLPHSGVSLVFTGIAVSTLQGIDDNSALLLSGTIAAAAIINEIIAVILAKQGFKWAGEIPTEIDKEPITE